MNENQKTDKSQKIFTVQVISKGRITIPEPMRIMHRIKDGDMVTLEILSVQNTDKKD